MFEFHVTTGFLEIRERGERRQESEVCALVWCLLGDRLRLWGIRKYGVRKKEQETLGGSCHAHGAVGFPKQGFTAGASEYSNCPLCTLGSLGAGDFSTPPKRSWEEKREAIWK